MLKVIRTTAEDIAKRSPLYAAGSEPLAFVAGFHGEELEGLEPFRWMGLEGRLGCANRAPAGRFAELLVFSPFFDLSQELTVEVGDHSESFPLLHGWSTVSLPVPADAESLRLSVNKPYPKDFYPDDPRDLTIRVRWPRLHADSSRHAHMARQRANAVLNTREMLAGNTRLESTPPQLGIDMYGACNVKPPCVYCAWDDAKAEEGANVDAPFDRETLEEWGEFFDNSRSLVNCSVGEPFMMKNFDELLDAFGQSGKFVEITTNGQILTDRNIEKLLGRNIELLISLDAATPETYAKLRNDKLGRILENLRRLIAAKGGRGGLPRVHLVFMPMKVNAHELDGFVELCADLQVDRMILRPLNWAENFDLQWDRAGYRFDYEAELLPFDELVRISGRAAELCRRHGVELSDQLDFGGAMEEVFEEGFESGRRQVAELDRQADPEGATTQDEPALPAASGGPQGPAAAAEESPSPEARPEEPLPSLGQERLPVCHEPWKSYYILRRGVMPCCYGGVPVAEMGAYRETWNSPLLQDIRAKLAAGRFHRYCYDSPSCPIVRKADAAGTLSPARRLFLRARSLYLATDRVLLGLPGRVYRPLKRFVLRRRGYPL